MGMLTAIQIRNFKEPGRYSDGEGLILKLVSPGRSSWIVRVQASGKRRDIGLVALADIGLGEAREAARRIRPGRVRSAPSAARETPLEGVERAGARWVTTRP